MDWILTNREEWIATMKGKGNPGERDPEMTEFMIPKERKE